MVEQRITISTTKTPENIPFKKDIPTIASPKIEDSKFWFFYNPCFGGYQPWLSIFYAVLRFLYADIINSVVFVMYVYKYCLSVSEWRFLLLYFWTFLDISKNVQNAVCAGDFWNKKTQNIKKRVCDWNAHIMHFWHKILLLTFFRGGRELTRIEPTDRRLGRFFVGL